MKFTYTYRSSDGQRHTAEIEAENRDAAFGRVRTELGIKPIKVVLAEGQDRNAQVPRRRWRVVVLGVVSGVGMLALAAWLWARRGGDAYQVMTPQGPVTLSVATPLARQRIPGDRARIEAAVAPDRDPPVFRFAAERWLARYAEPGREVRQSAPGDAVAPEDWRTCVREPIRIASTDHTEWVDLKRIVAGMKREMGAYLAAGGTVDGYLQELAKRQKLEASYRERAERRLAELLDGKGARSSGLAAAYGYWLKANAQLKSMGIWELPLPDELRTYQAGLDIDE